MKHPFLIALCAAALPLTVLAQTPDAEEAEQQSRLQIGGYGEATYSRNFYSDNPFRYKFPNSYKNDPSHGRFDIPHAVIYLNYNFGKGWKLGTEIEFEHGGTGGAVEKEAEEGGEWEVETEKGGEVELEQFWLEKEFCKQFHIRAGHIVVPIGLTNSHHEPHNFFTVYRPEGENTIMPCTWHQTGVSFWGYVGDFKYEAQIVSGLDANMFDRTYWIGKGAQSPYEFEVANKYGFVGRVDNYTVKGLRLGLSGYYGRTFHNSFPNENQGENKRYNNLKGTLYLGSFDFTYNDHNWIARGGVDYGYITDSKAISAQKVNNATGSSPYRRSEFGSHAVAASLEVGYDVFSQINKLREKQRLYVFGHAEYYDSYASSNNLNKYTKKKIWAAGINYYPIPQIAIKAEYHQRIFEKGYNNEPSINLGITYQGFFLR